MTGGRWKRSPAPPPPRDATWGGQLRTAGQAAAYLRIRRSDLAHLTRPGILRPVKYGRGPFDRRGQASVPLYRTG